MTLKKVSDLYENDPFLWYNENAKLIREKKFDQIDIENIAEELESMGKNERKILESYLIQLFMHLLKYIHQTERRSKSWEVSIKKQRNHVVRHLKENPSLKGHLNSLVETAYEDARFEATEETEMPFETFPEKMSFTLEQALKENWLPE
jgi:hypothetical protein